MAALDFPDSPFTGQAFDRWVYDGSKWVMGATAENVGLPWCRFDLAYKVLTPADGRAPLAWLTAPNGGFAMAGDNMGVIVAVEGHYRVTHTLGGNVTPTGGATYVAPTLIINGAVAFSRIQSLMPSVWNNISTMFFVDLAAGDVVGISYGGEFWASISIDTRFTQQGCAIEMMSA